MAPSYYMRRCLQLASLGAGYTAPNPMVGAVLAYQGRIIGEGYHERFGGPHAEINCINSVHSGEKSLIPHSELYVSLEPCAHFGKTPPCADRIIAERIPRVIIGCRDPFPQVDGKGIEKLRSAGVDVVCGILEQECIDLNRRFFTYYLHHRPYVTLKWAQTADGKIAKEDHGRLFISNEFTNRLVHKWRSEEASILVGTHTALFDDPSLTTRLWPGKNPVRLVIDLDLRLPSSLQLFNGTTPTIVFNQYRNTIEDLPSVLHQLGTDSAKTSLLYYQVTGDTSLVHQVLNALYHMKIQSVMVEGGASLLHSFIEERSWDEARVITNEALYVTEGLASPTLSHAQLDHEERLFDDRIQIFRKA